MTAPRQKAQDARSGLAATVGCPAAEEAAAGHPVRVVLVDEPAAPLWLSLYGECGRIGTAELSPLRALALAGDLLAAARCRLAEPERPHSAAPAAQCSAALAPAPVSSPSPPCSSAGSTASLASSS